MVLFKLQNDSFERTHIYARDPQDIVDLVSYYRTERLSPEELKDPTLLGWVKKVPSLDDIAVVESGSITYHVGMFSIARDPEDRFLHIPLVDDFDLLVTREALQWFDVQRLRLGDTKRAGLYKFAFYDVDFGAQYFVPADVMRAMKDLSLQKWYEEAAEDLERWERIAEHPNIHMVVRRNKGNKIDLN